MNIAATMVVAGVIMALSETLMGIFTVKPVIIGLGVMRLMTFLPLEWSYSIMETLSGALKGYGKTTVAAVTTLTGIVVTRIIWVYVIFPMRPTYRWLLVCYPLSWVVTAIGMIAIYFSIKRKVWGCDS